MTLDISQFYQTFFDEADELLAQMEQLLLGLNVVNPDPEDLAAIFRAAHSIKGGAATFGFTALTDTTHVLENLLDRARNNEIVLRPDMIDVFLQTKDVLTDQIASYRADGVPDPGVAAGVCTKLEQFLREGDGAPEVAEARSAESVAREPAAAESDVDRHVPNHVVEQALEVSGEWPGHGAAAAPTSGAAAAAAGHMHISLRAVNEKDKAALVDELGNLGRILEKKEVGSELNVLLDTDVTADDVVAVCCFLLDESQITVSRGAAPAGDEMSGNVSRSVADSKVISGPTGDKPKNSAPNPAPEQRAAGAAPTPEKARATAASSGEGSSIRVGVEKVDQLINLVGELVITQAMLEQVASTVDPALHDRLVTGMAQLKRNARDLQVAVMSVRMMPMDYVFSRFPRLVRDLAAKLGKEIDLLTEGAATELDKSLIERIVDPLTHLVRNSLDHGIETVQKRREAGKKPAGQLVLSAAHHGGNIVIEVRDDGAGLRRDKILAKAIQQGMQVNDSMTDDEVWNLIFLPGFSTAEQVTDVSGRGVGMDVVRRNIQSMGGSVEIKSRAGKGSTTRIVLPLTLAILDGMSVKVGDEIYILPLNMVMESLQPQPDDLYAIANGDRVVRVRGEYLPVVALHEVFGVAGARTDPTKGIVTIMESEGYRFAILVDELVGQQQVVVKNLETNYRKVHGVSAATILGDGRVSLIVDVGALSRTKRSNSPTRA